MIIGSAIGKRFAESTFENYKIPPGNVKAREACQDLARGGTKGVILHGPVGLGKTHLFVALTKEVSELIMAIEHPWLTESSPLYEELKDDKRLYRVAYWPILGLVDTMRKEMGHGAYGVVKDACEVDLLLLDDMGEEREMPFTVENLAHIFNARYNAMLPIGISTNLSLKELKAKYGDRAFSRWWETCREIEMKGKDYRTLKKEENDNQHRTSSESQ